MKSSLIYILVLLVFYIPLFFGAQHLLDTGNGDWLVHISSILVSFTFADAVMRYIKYRQAKKIKVNNNTRGALWK